MEQKNVLRNIAICKVIKQNTSYDFEVYVMRVNEKLNIGIELCKKVKKTE